VESQLAQSRSLLHWVRNVIHVRRGHPAFGLGDIDVLDSSHESVLSFVRSYRGTTRYGDEKEDILCVFSFSHHPIATTISAPELAGCRLFDLFGGGEFPPFDDNGTVTLTIGTQSFYWLHIARPTDSPFSQHRRG
jgi:maltose alpha-D-glucosyltransferase/alpha-amylase